VRKSGHRILVVYWNPYGRRMRISTAAHLDAVCRVGGSGEVLALNAHGGVPPIAATVQPTAVILHTTFLGIRWLASFDRWRARTGWIAELGCPVIALPQDDFDHAAVLDDWLDELGVNHLFTSLPAEAGLLYPRMSKRARVTGVLTGYVDRRLTSVEPPTARETDVVYRATRLPFWFGQLGQLKAAVGDQAQLAAQRLGLTSDVSLDSRDAITGKRWMTFLSSGRTIVGAESGSSVIDPDGSLRREVQSLLHSEPGLRYEDVVERIPADWDRHWFAVVSPRHLEAAATRTVQVLVEGTYSGVLEPGRHFVPVRRDLSDLEAALAQALDPDVATATTAAAHADVIESGRYAAERLTDVLRGAIGSGEGRPAPAGAFEAARVAARAWDAVLGARASSRWARRAGAA
jgi:hypothetical protein